jgi:hypothetical protein
MAPPARSNRLSETYDWRLFKAWIKTIIPIQCWLNRCGRPGCIDFAIKEYIGIDVTSAVPMWRYEVDTYLLPSLTDIPGWPWNVLWTRGAKVGVAARSRSEADIETISSYEELLVCRSRYRYTVCVPESASPPRRTIANFHKKYDCARVNCVLLRNWDTIRDKMRRNCDVPPPCYKYAGGCDYVCWGGCVVVLLKDDHSDTGIDEEWLIQEELAAVADAEMIAKQSIRTGRCYTTTRLKLLHSHKFYNVH